MHYKNAFLTSAIVVLLIMPAFGNATQPLPLSASPALAKTIATSVDKATGNLDIAKAVDLAKSSAAYQSAVAEYSNVEFNSVFNTWSFDSAGSVTWNNVNAVFSVSNSSGFTKNLVITEDTEATSVKRVYWEDNNFIASDYNLTRWAGYTPYSTYGGGAVYEAYSQWQVPSVSRPGTQCVSRQCNLAVWVGLTADQYGYGGIVQAGSQGYIDCPSTCTTTYKLWYQFYPDASPVSCMTVSASDSVSADVLNQGYNGGDNTKYNVYLSDYTTGTGCGPAQGTVYDCDACFSIPYYGQFIAERPIVHPGVPATLPQFSSVTMSQSMIYYSGANHYINDPYNDGRYYRWTMVNSGYVNIQVGSVQSSGTFTQTWQTSQGTYV